MATKIKIDDAIEKAWPQIRKDAGYPALRKPEVGETHSGTAHMEMDTKRIVVDPNFIKMLLDRGLGLDTAIKGVLTHEVGHYRHHPYDLATLLLELNELKYLDGGNLGGVKANSARLHFDDIVDNLMLIMSGNHSEIAEVYKALSSDSPVLKLSKAYYSLISGTDFGQSETSLDKELNSRFEKLKSIDFLDRKSFQINIRRYAGIVADLLEKDGDLGGICHGTDIRDFDKRALEQAMREIAEKLGPQDFKKLLEYAGAKIEGTASPTVDPEQADVDYYRILAEKYPIKIMGLPVGPSETLYKESMRPWELGSNTRMINPFKSFGKLIPGITKSWQERALVTHGTKEKIPDSIVLIDSSGSMPNPREKVSNAVIGAFAVAIAYTRNGSGADVINFSEGAEITEYTNSERKALAALARYQGQGTRPPREALSRLLSAGRKDITVITDGFRGATESDMEGFMLLLDKAGSSNRVTYISIEEEAGEANVIRYPNIHFHNVRRTEDIGSIVLGDIKWQKRT